MESVILISKNDKKSGVSGSEKKMLRYEINLYDIAEFMLLFSILDLDIFYTLKLF